MADETGKSDVLNPYGLNPNSGKPMPWARESLAVSLVPNVTQARLYTCWAPGHEPDWAKPRQPEMRAWDPAEDERRRAAANNLGILFLGPVFGAPAALARMAGAPEPVVESMGQVGLDLAGVAGVPGARGGGRVIEPVPMRPVPTMPRNTGVVILKPKIIYVNPKNLKSRQDSSEMTNSRVEKFKKDMKKNGYDESQGPIDVVEYNGKYIIEDGHHRALAAAKAGLDEVPVRVLDVPPDIAKIRWEQAQDAAAARSNRTRY